ncbi:MAG TPA: hypothetical protein VF932_08485 [Anaerolineae bacterium]
MDPAALAAAATALLVPFLSKVGQGMADQAEKKLPEQVEQIWQAVLAKFRGQPAAEASAGDLKAKANEEDNQAAFAIQLKKALKDDPAFADELTKLLQAAQNATGMTAGVSGAVASQGSVAAGQINVGGSVGGSVVVGSHNQVTGGGAAAEDDKKRSDA